jgi:hypothetical protein
MESQDAPTRRGPTFNLLNPEGWSAVGYS